MTKIAKHAEAIDDGRCHATSRTTGERCSRTPCEGLKVCQTHGGSTARSRARTAAYKAAREMSTLTNDAPPIGVPAVELLAIAARAKRLMEVLEVQASQLRDVRYASGKGEQTRGELLAYERAIDRVARILTDIMRLGLDERMVRVNEKQADVMVGVVHAVMRHMGLREGTPEWMAAGAVAGRELRRIGPIVTALDATEPR